MMDNSPISREEMVQLFGSEMPIEAVNLIWGADGDKTCGELRAELRQLARTRPAAADNRLVQRVARAIATSIKRQDDMDSGSELPADWDFKVDYLDQSEVDFLEVATAAVLASGRDGLAEALTDIRNRILCPVGPEPTLEQIKDIVTAALAPQD